MVAQGQCQQASANQLQVFVLPYVVGCGHGSWVRDSYFRLNTNLRALPQSDGLSPISTVSLVAGSVIGIRTPACSPTTAITTDVLSWPPASFAALIRLAQTVSVELSCRVFRMSSSGIMELRPSEHNRIRSPCCNETFPVSTFRSASKPIARVTTLRLG